jgi:hypothetical protein
MRQQTIERTYALESVSGNKVAESREFDGVNHRLAKQSHGRNYSNGVIRCRGPLHAIWLAKTRENFKSVHSDFSSLELFEALVERSANNEEKLLLAKMMAEPYPKGMWNSTEWPMGIFDHPLEDPREGALYFHKERSEAQRMVRYRTSCREAGLVIAEAEGLVLREMQNERHPNNLYYRSGPEVGYALCTQ